MAEGVQNSMILMSPVFAELERIGLFTKDQLNDIKIKHSDFEYKIRSITKKDEHYIEYIEYEKSLLKQIKAQREARKIGAGMGNIENKLTEKILKLYEKALLHSSGNFELCVSRFMFCKLIKYTGPATAAVDFLLKHHPQEEKSFCLAASWYARDLNNYKEAFQILIKGLAKHDKSKLLYTLIISLELSQAQEIKRNSNSNEDKYELCCEKIKQYLIMAFKHITDIEFYIELLELFESYEFSTSLKQYVVDNLMLNCTAEKKKEFWMAYLKYLTERKGRCSRAEIIHYLNNAHEEGCLPEKFYYYWLETKRDNDATAIFKKALEMYPRSDKLWLLYMHFKIRQGCSAEETSRIFEEAVSHLQKAGLPLWLEYIKYHMSVPSSTDVIQSLYEKAIKQPEEISKIFKPLYLKWLNKMGMEAVRKVYDRIADEIPYCKEMHNVMAELEQISHDTVYQEKVFKLKIKQFPQDVNAQIDYIDFLKQTGAGRDKIINAYNQALCMLPEYSKQLKALYELYINSI